MKNIKSIVEEYFPAEKIFTEQTVSFRVESKGKLKNATLGFSKFQVPKGQMIETEHFYFFDRREYLVAQSIKAYKIGGLLIGLSLIAVVLFYVLKLPKPIIALLFFPSMFGFIMLITGIFNVHLNKTVGAVLLLRKDLIQEQKFENNMYILSGKNTFTEKFFDTVINTLPKEKKNFFFPGKNLVNMPILKWLRKKNISNVYTDFIITYTLLNGGDNL